MKKNWKIIVGVIFLVGGFGCIGSDIGAAIFGIVVGVVFTAWWILGHKKALDKKSTMQDAPRPTVQVKPKTAVQAAPHVPSNFTPTKRPSFPCKKDGAPEAYRYSIAFIPSSPDVVACAIQEERWYLTAGIESGTVHLFLDGIDLGILPERADMMADWLKRGDPYIIAIELDKNGSDFVVTLVFYKDKQKYNAHREQTIVALTGYKSKEKQYTISILEEGEELEAEEDSENEDRVLIVSRLGDLIGSLPKKYARRVIDEGTALIVFDHDEQVEDSDNFKPFVKIYWR